MLSGKMYWIEVFILGIAYYILREMHYGFVDIVITLLILSFVFRVIVNKLNKDETSKK